MMFIYGNCGLNHSSCLLSNAFVKHCQLFSPENFVLRTSTFSSMIMGVSEPPICCSVWRFKLVPACYGPPKATPNKAAIDQDGRPIKHCRSIWAVRIANSLIISAASWSVNKQIYSQHPPARSLGCLYYVFWFWRPNGIPRRGALACKAAP